MLRRTTIALAVLATTASLAAVPALAAKPVSDRDVRTGGMQGQVPARGAHSSAKPTGSVNMSWHSGQIMTSSVTQAVFWGTSWNETTDASGKIGGLDTWYGGFHDSNYAKTNIEYTGTNGTVGTSSTYQGHHVDNSAAPSSAPSVQTVLDEVNKVIGNAAQANGYYAVYVDTKRGNAGYCAWHSYGTGANGQPIQIAFFFNLDGDAGCDPQDTTTGHSQGLAALANVSGHELSEAMTDPRNGGWYDRQGNENGDKCAWTFNVPSVTFSNGSQWKIQGEWSNAASNAGTGYPNRSGQRGCLDGH